MCVECVVSVVCCVCVWGVGGGGGCGVCVGGWWVGVFVQLLGGGGVGE